jgi:pyruvate kinase
MAEEMLEAHGHVRERQIVGIVAGTRTRSGATNFMRLHMIGDRDIDSPPKATKKKAVGKPAKKPAKKATKKR